RLSDNKVLWRHDKGTAYVASGVLYDGSIYLITDAGLWTSLDAKAGKLRYEGGRPPVASTFFASPVAFDGKVLITSQDGDTFVIAAGPRHEVLKRHSVGAPGSA